MKNVTISLDERLLDQARDRAKATGKSLNEYIRFLLDDDSGESQRVAAHASFDYVDRLGKRSAGPYLTREEANERR